MSAEPGRPEGDAEVEAEDGSPTGSAQQAPPSAFVEERRAAGNEFFKAADHEAALGCYGDALRAMDASGFQDPASRSALASNQALCLLRLDRPAEAEERASAALAADPGNGKAAYRRGLARLQLGNAQGACEDLQKAARLEPQSREVRQKYEEARQLAEAAPADVREVAVASSAASVLGGADGGLYSEKHDLNEGRLAETHREQKEWIKSIKDWAEITDISFADEESKNCISVYMTLPGVHEIPANKVCVWMRPTSLEVRVIDLRGSNWSYVAQELWGQIDAEASSYKIRRDKLSLKLQKRASARSWDRWEKLRRI